MTNKEFNESFRKRALEFALKIIEFVESVPFNTATKVLSYQLCKSGTSIGANHRAFCCGRSRKEMFSKICIVVEEGDETIYWLEIFTYLPYGNKELLPWLLNEAKALTKISSKTKASMTNDRT